MVDEKDIDDAFLDFIVCGLLPNDSRTHQNRIFLFDVKNYMWDGQLLFRECADNIIRHCNTQFGGE